MKETKLKWLFNNMVRLQNSWLKRVFIYKSDLIRFMNILPVPLYLIFINPISCLLSVYRFTFLLSNSSGEIVLLNIIFMKLPSID